MGLSFSRRYFLHCEADGYAVGVAGCRCDGELVDHVPESRVDAANVNGIRIISVHGGSSVGEIVEDEPGASEQHGDEQASDCDV